VSEVGTRLVNLTCSVSFPLLYSALRTKLDQLNGLPGLYLVDVQFEFRDDSAFCCQDMKPTLKLFTAASSPYQVYKAIVVSYLSTLKSILNL
jgi:hypothetical protein